MNAFTLDSRLAQDCHRMGRLPFSELLLMNNADYPWFILVPRTRETELYALEPALQAGLMTEVNRVAAFVKTACSQVEKLNVAAIGNIVRQLHVHVVGRHEKDPAWPGVVWGTTVRNTYTSEALARLRAQLHSAHLPGFTPLPD
ncbi:hypothetical protein BI364_06690 [Acidihalobacter yilgarnensis]|uniref:HIT domain-containing protein n=1 Tax=Acidihalobacter yilgarnensis TaxID=2819280 RepID=A0A1D8IMN2_9GAMM|nr:HIT family protein [Acidihalobacter yilgarnensis]AOU97685.1 hypothetical protein BI364_06690 [Acidihalobacter yilgarnensis]